MSRIGKKIITLPDGVEVKINGRKLDVKGKLGTLHLTLTENFEASVEGKTIKLTQKGDDSTLSAEHGLLRSLLANMIIGVHQGFERTLKIVGVGYKAEVQGKNLKLALGFSHPINFPLPEGIQAAYDNKANTVTVKGCDRRLVGETAAQIRRFRPPEPYKGKGVMYSDEIIERKVGKTGAKGAAAA